MKKLFCFVLSIAVTVSCFCFADSGKTVIAYAETENRVQVQIAPFLYKSTLYQMEFPSHSGYEIKEKSVAGDYAISRKLNDLSYTFVFPAGTTKK